VYQFTSIAQLHKDYLATAISCKQIVEALLLEIKSKSHLNIYLEVFEQEALKQAEDIDVLIKQGISKPMLGVVVSIKDNILYKGHTSTASSKILTGFKSIYHATVVERLLAAGAVIIGRTNSDEFAMGSSNEKSAYGKVLNPLNEHFVPGGSSGGAAAAIAARLCHVALGSDTGGSIRQPASFCGVIGVKPTYGSVSRYGLIAYASSFDQIGPLTTTIADATLTLEVIAGQDNFDSTLSAKAIVDYQKVQTQLKYKIAYLKDCVEHPGIDSEIKAQFYNYIEILKANGHSVSAVDFPVIDYLVPTYYVLSTAEASSNLSRFDGIRYGYRSPNATDLESTYKLTRSEGFGEEVKRRIMLGSFVLSAGYYDAYYSKAQKVRRLLRDQMNTIFKDHDFIITPTTPGTAFEFGGKDGDPVKMYLEDIFTVLSNLVGGASISLPLFKHSNGMPFGFQIMAAAFADDKMMAFSKQLMGEI
jgi:aspartyl-tRNA(Asn)/glutamyl-tRNA(Gln) amidotransferase subunit A